MISGRYRAALPPRSLTAAVGGIQVPPMRPVTSHWRRARAVWAAKTISTLRGLRGEVPTRKATGVVADRVGRIEAAAPAGVLGVEALGDLLREGPRVGPAGGVVRESASQVSRSYPGLSRVQNF